jgi:hypothetical protein
MAVAVALCIALVCKKDHYCYHTRPMARAVLLVLGWRRWACKAALPLAVLLARATRPSGWGGLEGVLRVCGVLVYVGPFNNVTVLTLVVPFQMCRFTSRNGIKDHHGYPLPAATLASLAPYPSCLRRPLCPSRCADSLPRARGKLRRQRRLHRLPPPILRRLVNYTLLFQRNLLRPARLPAGGWRERHGAGMRAALRGAAAAAQAGDRVHPPRGGDVGIKRPDRGE